MLRKKRCNSEEQNREPEFVSALRHQGGDEDDSFGLAGTTKVYNNVSQHTV